MYESHEDQRIDNARVIDVQKIVDDIRARVDGDASSRSAGFRRFGRRVTEMQPGRVVLRPEMAISGKRGIGAAVTAVKKLDLRLNWQFLTDLVAQVNAALEIQRRAHEAETRRRAELEQRIASLEEVVETLTNGRQAGSGSPPLPRAEHPPESSDERAPR